LTPTIRQHCIAQGHPSLLRLARGTVSKILRQSQVRPHKISYYLERRDPDFETQMAQVLYVYRKVQIAQRQLVLCTGDNYSCAT
jgi:hypothetical protein